MRLLGVMRSDEALFWRVSVRYGKENQRSVLDMQSAKEAGEVIWLNEGMYDQS
jgi:hypothetical protein